jgi:hypothetical protein
MRYAALFEASVYHTLAPQGHAQFVARETGSDRRKGVVFSGFGGVRAIKATHQRQHLVPLVFGRFGGGNQASWTEIGRAHV